MRFSYDPDRRREQVMEVLAVCTHDQDSRRSFHSECRQRYLFGGSEGSSTANKIRPIVDRQQSFLYASDTIKFWVELLPEEENAGSYERVDAVSDSISDSWRDSGMDKKFGAGLKFSLIDGTAIGALFPRMRTDRTVTLVSHVIKAHDFGVWNSGQTELSEQQAVTMNAYFTKEELARRLARHPNLNEIFYNLEYGDAMTGGGEGAIIFSPGATQYQAVYANQDHTRYEAKSMIPYYRMVDLYAWDDELEDYRWFTLSGNYIVHDRPITDMGVAGRLPFFKICPNEMDDLFWGVSLVNDLSFLQDWYVTRMAGMDELFAKQLNPPIIATGLGQSYEEKLDAAWRAKGRVASPNAQAKVQQLEYKMPAEAFEMIQSIDTQMIDQSSMRPSMFGKQESGVRTEGMAASMLRVGGAEMRAKGLRVESQAEDGANLLYRFKRNFEDVKLRDGKGNLFLLSEFPESARVRVDGHSSSPLFIEDFSSLAQGLKREGAINESMMVELLQPPMKGKILHDLAKIQAQKTIAQEVAKIQQEEKRGGAAGAHPK
jgi:hypothetical protein